MKVLTVINGVPQSRARNDDDGFDRLSHRYTTAMLITFSLFMTSTQFVGNPIKCWVPAHFTGSHEEYTNNYCWVKNTYYLDWEEYIPREHEHELRHMITYYQWVPIILLFQALLFFLPCQVWRWYNVRSGIDVNDIVESGQSFHKTDNIAKKDEKLDEMVKQMDRYLECRTYYNRTTNVGITSILSAICRCCSRRRGNFLVILYTFVKLLYLANAIGQMFMLDYFMNHSFSSYGFYAISSMIKGENWMASERFPRVTMCDFKLRRMGSNLQRYTVQCTLPHNIFNEKIFLFVWFWMAIVALFTLYGLIRWVVRFMFRGDHHRYVGKHLRCASALDNDPDAVEKTKAVRFVDKYLKPDGVFVLRLVDINTDVITANEFIVALWELYKGKPIREGNYIHPTTDLAPYNPKSETKL